MSWHLAKIRHGFNLPVIFCHLKADRDKLGDQTATIRFKRRARRVYGLESRDCRNLDHASPLMSKSSPAFNPTILHRQRAQSMLDSARSLQYPLTQQVPYPNNNPLQLNVMGR